MLELQQKNTYFLSCPRECEELLLYEVKSLGAESATSIKGGVFIQENIEVAFNILLKTRIASRMYLQLHSFKFKDEKQIAQKSFSYPWSELFSVHQTFKINTIFDQQAKKNFNNSLYFSQLMKDGIVDHFNKTKDKRPSVDTHRPDFHFSLRIEKSKQPQLWEAKISLDLTGFPLSNRGYRVKGHSAPLRENLAAAIIAAIDFNREDEVFIDSMSGTGTLLVEAMLKHLDISPSFIWVRKELHDISLFKMKQIKANNDLKSSLRTIAGEVIQHNQDQMKQLKANTFFAFDISGRYLDILKKTISKTGLDWKKIRLHKKDALSLRPPYEGAKGVILCNPPYGKRLGEVEELENIYHQYGENLKQNFKGFKAYIFTSNPQLRKKVSLQTSQRIPFYNGELECRLLRYNLY